MRFLYWIDLLNDRIGRLASILVWVGAAVLVWEVIARYVFNSPTIWVHGYTQRIFGSYFILIGAFTLLRQGHVRIDLFLPEEGTRRRSLMDLLNYTMLLLFGAALSTEGWTFFQEALLWGEVDDGALGHPLWPVKLCLFIGSVLISIQAIAEILRALVGIVAPETAMHRLNVRR